MIASGRSCAASAYRIIWGDACQNKHGRITAECHSVVCSGDSVVLTELRHSNKIEVIVLHDQKSRELRNIQTTRSAVYLYDVVK